MKSFIAIFLFVLAFCSCRDVQTQQVSENKPQPTPAEINSNNEHYGYSRFTTSDKQYLGCWRSTKTEEVVEYELKFFRLTERAIQTSKMPKPTVYIEVESNSYKDYFILQTESKNKELQPFLSINMVNVNEMTVHEFATKEDISDDGKGLSYWNLKRENCNIILKKFKKK